MTDRMDDVLASIDAALDGADDDWTVSGDAMRWAPPEAERETPKRPVDRYTIGRSSYHNPPSMAVPMRNGAQTADAWAEAWERANEPPPTGEEFRRRALEARRNRNTGPTRRDNRRWRNT